MVQQLESKISKGIPFPLGVSLQGDLLNFSLVSKSAMQAAVAIFERHSGHQVALLPFDPQRNKTGNIWHLAIAVPKDMQALAYAYIIDNQRALDPYARCVLSPTVWGTTQGPNGYRPLAELSPPPYFDFGNDSPLNIPLQELVIYEMHVRGFTQHPSSKTTQPGKFLGVIEKIPHLLDLGVNALELLPMQEFDECEYSRLYPQSQRKLYNYWGYSTVNFFAPMNRYAVSEEANGAIHEFKTMVKELHRNGIELILDVVFNHTSEGGEKGPRHSYKVLGEKTYYMLDSKGHYLNYTGTGNTFNVNHPVCIDLIISALRYCVTEMHVDGFRFDLAAILNRSFDGSPRNISSLVRAISEDPCLANVKLIAEPWDAAGLYQLGLFSPVGCGWSEWNDKYRDGVRRFIKGTPGTAGDFSKRICGSEDLFHGHSPLRSLNFITAHDGYSLADLVSYNHKHNQANGENNRDGSDHNESWNCGAEGSTTLPAVLALRERQMRNFHMALMLSQGVPMILMGDEYGHSKQGNNNTWCQDNELNWFRWDQLENNRAFYRFYRLMIQLRKKYSSLHRNSFLTNQDIDWHGLEPLKPDWSGSSRFTAFTLKMLEEQLYIAFNAQAYDAHVTLPPPLRFKTWRWVVNTAQPSPEDFYENGNGPLQIASHYEMRSFSAIILKC